jgi:hypothetical protein
MKKGMIGRTKKRLSKKNRGTRKVGGFSPQTTVGLIMLIFFFMRFMHDSEVQNKKDYLKKLFKNVSEESTVEQLKNLLESPAVIHLPSDSQKSVLELVDFHKALENAHKDSSGYLKVYEKDVEEAFTKIPPESLKNAEELLINIKEVSERVVEARKTLRGAHGKDIIYVNTMLDALDEASGKRSGSRSHSAHETSRSSGSRGSGK